MHKPKGKEKKSLKSRICCLPIFRWGISKKGSTKGGSAETHQAQVVLVQLDQTALLFTQFLQALKSVMTGLA